MFSILVVAHVISTTTGFMGLIAANLWLMQFCRGHRPEIQAEAIHVWRRSAQFFGPLLGIGVLLGFALISLAHEPLVSAWLIATYALIALALGTQAAIMVPWQLRSNHVLALGGSVSPRPPMLVLLVLSLAYVSILSLMLLRPA